MSRAAATPSRIAATLRCPREAIEAAFLDVGGRLADCAGELGALGETFEQLPRDFESAELQEAATRLEAVASETARMAGSFAAEGPTMTELAKAIAAAGAPIGRLSNAIKAIGIVAVNARIAAAGLVGAKDGVSVFTTDIGALAEEAATTVQSFARHYEALSKEVRRAAEQRKRFEGAQEGTLRELAERIEARLRMVALRRTEAAAASVETGRMSRRIAEQVSAAVFALQVGDNTRQRIEHVEAALLLAEGGAEAAPGEPSGLRSAICALQAAQMSDTVEVFTQEVTDAGQSVRALAEDASEMVRRSRSLYAGEDSNASVAELSVELRTAAALLSDCEEDRAKLDALTRDVVAAVGALLDHVGSVRSIEERMRLLSLNATVRCALLGPRGRGLSVIAEQIRELTGETAIAAEAAVARLESVGVYAREVNDAATAQSDEALGRLEADAIGAVELLETVDLRLAAALEALETKGARVVALLDAASVALARQRDIGVKLAQSTAQIEALAPAPVQFDMIAAPELEALADLRKRYTMESERRVHDALLGAPSGAVELEASSDEDDLEDMFL